MLIHVLEVAKENVKEVVKEIVREDVRVLVPQHVNSNAQVPADNNVHQAADKFVVEIVLQPVKASVTPYAKMIVFQDVVETAAEDVPVVAAIPVEVGVARTAAGLAKAHAAMDVQVVALEGPFLLHINERN